MMRSLGLVPSAVIGLLWWGAAVAAPLWTVEEGSELRFTASQQGQPIEGRFDGFTAVIAFDPADLETSRIEVEIDVASVGTAHRDRDTALRSAAFFDVDRWPTAHFVSERITARDGAGYAAVGELRIRDVGETVTLPFDLVLEDHPEDSSRLRATADGELTISRLAYGIGQGEWTSTATVGDEVVIHLTIVASRPR